MWVTNNVVKRRILMLVVVKGPQTTLNFFSIEFQVLHFCKCKLVTVYLFYFRNLTYQNVRRRRSSPRS